LKVRLLHVLKNDFKLTNLIWLADVEEGFGRHQGRDQRDGHG
jgi:hypothetical protein